MAGVLAIRAANPSAHWRAVAVEGAVIAARMAALWGVVARRVATIAANRAARNAGLGTIHRAIVAVAANVAFT